MPERFLPERRDGIDRFAYLPFGAGPRVCIGATFSLQEAVIVLASAVRAARFTLVAGHAVMPGAPGDAAPRRRTADDVAVARRGLPPRAPAAAELSSSCGTSRG